MSLPTQEVRGNLEFGGPSTDSRKDVEMVGASMPRHPSKRARQEAHRSSTALKRTQGLSPKVNRIVKVTTLGPS